MNPAERLTATKHYYVAKNGERRGPIPFAQFEQMLASGEITSGDLCWTEGLTNWQPVHTVVSPVQRIVSLPDSTMPPPLPHSLNTQHSNSAKLINWIPALVFYSIVTTVSSLIELVELSGNSDVSQVLALLGLPLVILGIIFVFMLHYNCWKALPEKFRYTTPGKAVGYLFIPFYNFYWAFVTFPKLSEGIVKWQESRLQRVTDTRGLAITYAVLFVCGLTIGLIPGFGIVIGIADLVIFILYYRQVVSAINSLLR